MADRSRRAPSGNANGAFRERIAASSNESGTAAVGGRLSRHKAGATTDVTGKPSTSLVRVSGRPRAAGGNAAHQGMCAALLLQRPHASPRPDNCRSLPCNEEATAISAIGRRATSSKVPAPSAAIATQLAEVPAEDFDAAAALDTFAQLGVHLQAACSKVRSLHSRGEAQALGACVSAIGNALQQCGKAVGHEPTAPSTACKSAGTADHVASVPPAATAAAPPLESAIFQELRNLRLENDTLQRKVQSWLAERDKLHSLVDELRHQARHPRLAVTAKPPIPCQVEEDREADTDRSASSDAPAVSHRPALKRPKIVPSLNFTGLKS